MSYRLAASGPAGARAQLDCSWAEHRLSEILATDEATTAFKAKVAGLDL
jgi:hypothetical protein